MRPLDYVAEALSDLRAAKLRSLLTSLGIIIGVGSVVLMLSLGEGVKQTVTSAFGDLGSTRITVVPSAPGDDFGGGGGGGFGGGVASTLTVDDAVALRSVDDVAAAAPTLQVPARLDVEGRQVLSVVTGTQPAYFEIVGQELQAGRGFTAGSAEAVITRAAAEDLFGADDPLGMTVTVAGAALTVVGVVADPELPFGGDDGGAEPAEAGEPREPSGGNRLSGQIFVPIERSLDIAGANHVAQITIAATDPSRVESVVAGVESVLAERHDGVDDFSVTSFSELLRSFTEIFDVITAFLAALAGISLLVGGIGIMNIMLVVVTERTREIGIAKAIGATSADVVVQFLIEAVLLSVIGGLIGLGVAALGALAIGQLLDVDAAITPGIVALALGVSSVIGIFFGVLPAWRAARLDPIAALRHE